MTNDIKRYINEAIEIDGAQHIGSNFEYDLFLINTFDAAQQFVKADSDTPAGAAFTQNETTFNNHLGNGNLKLYFFVRENTNQVVLAILKGNNTNSTINFGDHSVNVNFEIETINHNSNYDVSLNIPFYLIPDITYGDYVNDLGLIIQNNTLVKLNQYFARDVEDWQYDDFNIPNTVTKIKSKAFCDRFASNYNIDTLHIPNSVTEVESEAFEEGYPDVNIHLIKVYYHRRPEGWAENWIDTEFEGTSVVSGLSQAELDRLDQEAAAEEQARLEREEQERLAAEEQARLEAEAAAQRQREEEARLEAERLEAERLERERLEREEQERLAKEEEEREILRKSYNSIIYKEHDTHIEIIRTTKEAPKELIIPEFINNKPVTTIASYAFYNKDFSKIVLPKSITEVGSGAFYGKYEVHIPKEIINKITQGKNSFLNNKISY